MRRIIGIIVAIVLAGAAGMAAIGEQMAKARLPAAASLPLNSAASAKRFLDGGTNPLSADQSRALATSAIHSAPVSTEAAVLLSDLAYASGDNAGGLAILQAAARLGWHGELVQRVSYIRALERQDYATAEQRAEALLRRGRAREQLAADFAEAGDNPEFRSAIIAALTEDAPWANGLLVEQGSQIPFAMLRDIFRARSDAGTPIPRQNAAPIISNLAIGGKLRQGAELFALMEGSEPDRLIPGWPSAEAEEIPTIYDWRLFEGYTPLPAIDGNGFELTRTSIPGARPAQLFIALAPGTYRLSVPTASSAQLAGWRYAFACGSTTPRPVTRLKTSQMITVPSDCPTQAISLAADLQTSGADGLPELALQKVR